MRVKDVMEAVSVAAEGSAIAAELTKLFAEENPLTSLRPSRSDRDA